MSVKEFTRKNTMHLAKKKRKKYMKDNENPFFYFKSSSWNQNYPVLLFLIIFSSQHIHVLTLLIY